MIHDQKMIKRNIIEVLQEIPIITHAVKKVGISRMTLHRWIKKDKVFERNLNAAVMEGHKNMIDENDIATREYAKYVLKEGSITEKRELLGHLRSRLVLKNKTITLLEEDSTTK